MKRILLLIGLLLSQSAFAHEGMDYYYAVVKQICEGNYCSNFPGEVQKTHIEFLESSNAWYGSEFVYFPLEGIPFQSYFYAWAGDKSRGDNITFSANIWANGYKYDTGSMEVELDSLESMKPLIFSGGGFEMHRADGTSFVIKPTLIVALTRGEVEARLERYK
jgi:hypothetical protein